MFKCQCGKSVKLPKSLQKHAKNCTGERTTREEIQEDDVSMHEEDSDVFESMNVDEAADDTPEDCYGTLLFIKIANCRQRGPSKNRLYDSCEEKVDHLSSL